MLYHLISNSELTLLPREKQLVNYTNMLVFEWTVFCTNQIN